MPMYEYRCKQCGHRMDVLVKSSHQKRPAVVCETCGSKEAEKIIAGFSVGQGDSAASSCSTCCPTGTCGLP